MRRTNGCAPRYGTSDIRRDAVSVSYASGDGDDEDDDHCIVHDAHLQ
jgi:hypothetical protein